MNSFSVSGTVKKASEFFENIESRLQKPGLSNSLFVLYGDDAFLSKRLKNQVKALGFELTTYEIKKSGPDADLLDLCAGTSLFVSQKAVWIQKLSSPQSWRKDSQKIWEKLLEFLENGDVKLFAQSSSDKPYSSALLESATNVSFDLSQDQIGYWISKLNTEKGGTLSADKLRFLQSLEQDMLSYENILELWSLGGDLWAEKSLGWGAQSRSQKSAIVGDNPAYTWVDATLSAKTDVAVQCLSELEGQEPLMLLGLLSKSVKIMAQLDAGVQNFKSEPPFLVTKLKKLKTSLSQRGLQNRGLKLLRECARVDRQMKSTRANPWTLLARLSEN
jgi:DNA polymerase III delta subunit